MMHCVFSSMLFTSFRVLIGSVLGLYTQLRYQASLEDKALGDQVAVETENFVMTKTAKTRGCAA